MNIRGICKIILWNSVDSLSNLLKLYFYHLKNNFFPPVWPLLFLLQGFGVHPALIRPSSVQGSVVSELGCNFLLWNLSPKVFLCIMMFPVHSPVNHKFQQPLLPIIRSNLFTLHIHFHQTASSCRFPFPVLQAKLFGFSDTSAMLSLLV